MINENIFPPGWNEDRVHRVLDHYEHQTEEEAVAEDEAAYEQKDRNMVEVPNELLPKVRELIARYWSEKERKSLSVSVQCSNGASSLILKKKK